MHKVQPIRVILIAAIAMLYALMALPLPYLLIDHSAAMQLGDSQHSEDDVHAWLEWAVGSSLSGAGLVLPSVLLLSVLLSIPSVQQVSKLHLSVEYSRGPPATV